MRNSDNYKNNNGRIAVNAVCAIVSLLFTFCYLLFFQSDMLVATQHILSKGQTVYSPFLGAVILSLLFMLVQIAVCLVIRKSRLIYAMSYFPSFLLLGVLTSFNLGCASSYDTHWLWTIPLALLGWYVVLMFVDVIFTYFNLQRNAMRQTKSLWLNLLIITLFICTSSLIGNGNDVMHYRLRMESLMQQRRFAEAAVVGQESKAVDSSLSMLRLYALSRTGDIGGSLFTLPLSASDSDLYPFGDKQPMFYPADSIFRHLGAIPKAQYKHCCYLNQLILDGKASDAVFDYQLAGYLLNRDLESFCGSYHPGFTCPDSLPVHYREALVLASSKYLCHYSDSVMEDRYRRFAALNDSVYSDRFYRRNALKEFNNTYWSYYYK